MKRMGFDPCFDPCPHGFWCVKMCEGSIASCFFQNPRSPSLVMPIVTMLSDLIPTMSHLWVKWFLGPRIAYLYIYILYIYIYIVVGHFDGGPQQKIWVHHYLRRHCWLKSDLWWLMLLGISTTVDFNPSCLLVPIWLFHITSALSIVSWFSPYLNPHACKLCFLKPEWILATQHLPFLGY